MRVNSQLAVALGFATAAWLLTHLSALPAPERSRPATMGR
jgi:hypothetical protein